MVRDFYLNGLKYFITKHAAHRAKRRGISLEDIKSTLTDYRTKRPTYDADGGKCYRYTGRNFVVIVINPEVLTIITVLRANTEHTKAKNKAKRNKNRLDAKKRHGNRIKK